MDRHDRLRSAQRVALIAMGVTGLLAALKIFAGWNGHSAAVLADGMESAADVFSSGMVYLGLYFASRPADSNHPYGHGRAEILTGLVLGLTLFAAGALIAWTAILKLGDAGERPAFWTIYTLVASIAVKFVLMGMKYRVSASTGSFALKADAANDGIDVLSGFVALAALSLTLWKPEALHAADHYGAFVVGLIVMFTAVRVTREASLHLMDTMPEGVLLEDVRKVALSIDGALGVEKCFARKTGLQYHVDLHLEVDPAITVRESHEIAGQVRTAIRRQLASVADVLVHVEPFPGR